MSKTIEFNETGEWTMDDAIELSFMESREQAEAEAEERSLKRVRELIENPEYREQAIKVSKEELARQSKILEQGRIPTVYDDDYVDDDDYDDDDYYDDDEEDCYPSLDDSVSCYDDE